MSRSFEERRFDDRREHNDRPPRYDERPRFDDRPPRSYEDRRDHGYPQDRRPYDDRRIPDDRRPSDYNRPPPRENYNRPPPANRGGYDRPDRGSFDRGYGDRGDRGGYERPRMPEQRNFQNQYPARTRAPNQLFVGSLAFSATEEDLRAAFPSAVTVRVQRERDSMRSRGFGFVAFAKPEDAAEALRTSDGLEICGRPVKLAEANQSGGAVGHRETPGKAETDAVMSTRSRSRSRQRQAASWNQEGAY